MLFNLLLLGLFLQGCRPADCDDNDQDCDGYLDFVDCNDTNPNINPGEIDGCGDYIDQNCDGVDGYREDEVVYYRDTDSDGYGNPGYGPFTSYCGVPDGYAEDPSDCDDFSFWINPEATEICDGLDNNCDGEVDEDCFWPL